MPPPFIEEEFRPSPNSLLNLLRKNDYATPVMAKKRGYFLVFEGGEGAGKTTQTKHLVKYLKQNSVPFIQTREPGGTRLGKLIRKILLNPTTKFISSRAELLLYGADRAQHVDEIIRPALDSGKLVISDRYIDSGYVYQGICRKLGTQNVSKLNHYATDGLKPDLVVVLNLPRSESQKRLKNRRLDRLEKEKGDFHHKVHEGFRKLAKSNPKRYYLVNASQPESEIAEEIRKVLTPKLKRRGLWPKK